MIDLPPIALPNPAVPALLAPGAGGPVPGFARTFDAAVASQPPPGLAAAEPDPDRQPLADDGKDLPEDSDRPAVDAVSNLVLTAFFFPPVVAPTPAPTLIASTLRSPPSPAISAIPASTIAPAPATAAAVATPPQTNTDAASLPVAVAVPTPPAEDAPAPVGIERREPAAGVRDGIVARPSPTPVVADHPAAATAATDGIAPATAATVVPLLPAPPRFVPVAGPPTVPTDASVPTSARRATVVHDAATPPPVAATPATVPAPQPARLVFAAAIATANGWRERGARHEPTDAPTIASAAPVAAAVRDIAAPSATPDVPLDLGSDTGTQQVIDRIATLRDALGDSADARDTRIRLTPDALGAVDIAVRADGDAVRVHFTAEHEATQALLLDAQPRLAELAAARGLRIAESSVSSGTLASDTSDTPGGRTARSPQPRARPARVASAIAEPATDIRLA